MSRNYDSWEKLVGAVLRKEKDRQLAYCESVSSYSTDFSFDSNDDFHDLPADIQDLVKFPEGKRFRLVKCPKCKVILPELEEYSLYLCGGCGILLRGIAKLMDGAEWSNWDDRFQPLNDMMSGLIKKSFRDFKKSNQGVEVGGSQVFVNGHLIPDRVVKKAEKLAGPIYPGEYWYDKQAGFWGVIGYPCLGIIMPNIEEFNYPIPKNCADGNTGVFINGRELHKKDLDLLASRGLPITENRSYIVDITGKVVDEQTGEELDGLGKLAPTVEKAKHGFGMKVPRFIAQTKS